MAPDTLSLAGKTVLVTGSGRETGIGAGIARALARNGASVAIHYISKSSKARAYKLASDLSNEFGTETIVVQGGIENSDTAKRMVGQLLKDFRVGHIDILVNNAATATHTPLMEIKQKQLESDFAINMFGMIYMIQTVVDAGHMPKGGRIINIGSIASKRLGPPPLYGSTKAASDALTTLWAAELGKSHGITVNTLAPGPVSTDMRRNYLVASDRSPTELTLATLQQTRTANRLGTAEDFADATLLICSEKSRWITAQYISVSGGVTGTM